MANTATYTVNNPSPGTHYIAPSAYWVIPNNATTVTCTAQTFDASGNLHTVTTLVASVHEVNNGFDSTFTGNNAYSTSAATSAGTNGSNVFAAAAWVGSGVAQLRMYLSYTGRIYDQPPGAPDFVAPYFYTINTLTPTFAGRFHPGTAGDTLAQYQITVYANSGQSGGVIWGPGIFTASSSEISAAAFSRVYSGPALSYGHTYSWGVRVINQNGLSSPTTYADFSTVQGPNVPSSVLPNGTYATLTPGISFLYTNPAGTAMQSYAYSVGTPGGSPFYYSGNISTSAANNATVTGTISSAAGLQYGQTYVFTLSCIDTNSAMSGNAVIQFTIAPLPQVTALAPINSQNVNTHFPAFSWNYNDPNYAQQSFKVQVYNNSTGSLIQDSGTVTSTATSWTMTTSVTYGTTIRWHVLVTDSAGLSSSYTAFAFAYVVDSPSGTITSPTNGSTITTNTPTVTWTYSASSGGQAQASAQLQVKDTHGNVLQTYTVTGAGTSYAIPSGVLLNNTTYQLTLTVTDTISNTGSSSLSFSLSYTAPADMQGQPISSSKNYFLNPYLNADSNSDGLADGLTAISFPTQVTGNYEIDDIITPVSRLDGDGQIAGAQAIVVTSILTGSSTQTSQFKYRFNSIPSDWTPGTTHISFSTNMLITAASGNPNAYIAVGFQNSSFTTLGSGATSTGIGDTAGVFVSYLGPQNVLIPSGTAYIDVYFRFQSNTPTDIGTVWFADIQVEAASASTAFLAGDMGTGYSYDSHGFSVRTQLTGGQPTLTANPGSDTDPLQSNGGTLTLSWDTSLADTRFTAYIIERRRQDQAGDDTTWSQIATLYDINASTYTDYTVGGDTVYQYSVRQQIIYNDGTTGVSLHRAITVGSVVFSPAWYLVNTETSQIYNMRLSVIDPKRKLIWKEKAQYSTFLGRHGLARDAGPAQGFQIDLVAYFNDSWGNVRSAIRRQLIAMSNLQVAFSLKDPDGLVVPVYLQDINIGEEDTDSDTMQTVAFSLIMAQATSDY